MKNTVNINSVELVNADSLQYIATLPDNSIDLIVTDPPYFKVKPNGWDNQWKGDEDYLRWLDMCLAQFWRVLKPAGSLYLFSGHRLAADIEIMMRERFNILNHIIWLNRRVAGMAVIKRACALTSLQQSASCSLSITRGRINQRATGMLRREAS